MNKFLVALALSLAVRGADAQQIPRPILLSFQLIDADSASRTRDPAIADLDTVLRKQTKLTAFRLVDRADAATDVDGHAEHDFSGAGSGSKVDVQLSDYRTDGTVPTVHLAFKWTYLPPAISGKIGKPGVMSGAMTVPVGHMVALTNTFGMPGQLKAVILTIRAQ